MSATSVGSSLSQKKKTTRGNPAKNKPKQLPKRHPFNGLSDTKILDFAARATEPHDLSAIWDWLFETHFRPSGNQLFFNEAIQVLLSREIMPLESLLEMEAVLTVMVDPAQQEMLAGDFETRWADKSITPPSLGADWTVRSEARANLIVIVSTLLSRTQVERKIDGLWRFTKERLLGKDNGDLKVLLEAFTDSPISSSQVVAESMMWND